jgi:ribosome-binding ATPase YchF (GTP1/OBG family)
MRIAHAGLGLPDGKHKYNDSRFTALVEKFQPVKLAPYFFEFRGGDFEAAQAIALAREQALDLLIVDLEKIEARLARDADPVERALLGRCQAHLEAQQPLCDLSLADSEREIVRALGFVSSKPTVLLDGTPGSDAVCRAVLDKAGMMFFYTVGKPEVHAWLVARHATAETCAGRIHTDLARGFIKAEIFTFDDIMASHSVPEARAKGLMKLVDRDFPVPEDSIIEIRFNV